MSLKQEIGRKSSFVKLIEDTHQYFNVNGVEYGSVSSLLNKVKVPFDRKGVSYNSAKGNLPSNATAKQIEYEQQRLLAEWDRTRDSSLDWGNFVHDNLEQFFLTGNCDVRVGPAAASIAKFVSYAKMIFPELCFHSSEHFYAGTADLPVIRKAGRSPQTTILDIYDYKTNESKGIEYSSAYIDKHSQWNPGGKFLLPPLDHLEQCNYNIYAMQLSCYGYMAQEMYGLQIGRLAILFVDKQMKVKMIPVPYLKEEAKQLFNLSKGLKNLPS